jgi:hypothetical protein
LGNLTFNTACDGKLTAEQLALQLLRLTEMQSGQVLAQTVVAHTYPANHTTESRMMILRTVLNFEVIDKRLCALRLRFSIQVQI